MPDHRARLAAIKRFDQLVTYLRDDMGWPIEGDDFEEITFDYTPDELGIDAANRAKIQQIKRLRPLAANQPWGIFFVRFEPKRLPVVALRRILSRVVLKKRAAANSPERAAWDLADLLFISNYGDDAERRISFAHFVQDDDWGDLPTLKVLGWDGDDTNLHLDEVARKLTTKLRWPDDEADVPGWRATWGDAFTLRHREVITTAKHLAERLADLARETRKKANAALAIESPTGPLRTLMDAFKKALIHDLDEDGFADMYAQTIAYGLLSARISRPEGLVADNMADMVPVTNPFLKEMLESFLRLGGRQRSGQGSTGIDFDELGINEIVQVLREANMEAVLRDFGDRNPQEDPVIHFYEHFLKEYDAKKRMQRGVFYTPRPVVSYIVRSVHELLQSEFGLADGLADTATWGEMLDRHPGLKLPLLSDSPGETQTISPDEPFVQVLDPATGTATFLVEVIEVIHQTLKAKWQGQRLSEAQQVAAWNDYVPKHLLPRLHGFELMMAPYAIAHMKIGLKLAETGYQFGSEERARIYLTNALEPWVRQLPLINFDALAHEAIAVNDIKRHKRFTVVVGNPPYSNFGQLNKNPFIHGLLEDYKRGLCERKLNLDDDFIKFIRFSQHIIHSSGTGVFGMITNSTFLDGVTHRKMRETLIQAFPISIFLNLHGNTKRKEIPPHNVANENVFDIMQGVSISLMVKPVKKINTAIHYCDVWGTREDKYETLNRSKCRIGGVMLNPTSDRFFLVEKDFLGADEYDVWPSIKSVFPLHSLGIETSRDDFAVAFEKSTIVDRVSDLCSTATDVAIRDKYGLDDKRDWTLPDARRILREIPDILPLIRCVQYRPYDVRFVCYFDAIVTWPRHEVLDNLLQNNLALICVRNSREDSTSNFYCARHIADKAVISSRDNATIFPLHRLDSGDSGSLFSRSGTNTSHNFSLGFLKSLVACLGEPAQGDSLPAGLTPEDILHYIYAVFHSPGYRSRYAEFLKIDFPRLPLTWKLELFRALAQLGGELVALHLLESPTLNQRMTELIGSRNPEVEKPAWSKDTVWVDKRQTTGFVGVPEAVWSFHIGGYQVCHKWLKDRKGRTLSDEDIAHYHKIVVSLNETIRLMQEIDAVIDQHGGWPGAFVLNGGEQA
jgi:hypothetical protein